jgi:hypothetical protein
MCSKRNEASLNNLSTLKRLNLSLNYMAGGEHLFIIMLPAIEQEHFRIRNGDRRRERFDDNEIFIK